MGNFRSLGKRRLIFLQKEGCDLFLCLFTSVIFMYRGQELLRRSAFRNQQVGSEKAIEMNF